MTVLYPVYVKSIFIIKPKQTRVHTIIREVPEYYIASFPAAFHHFKQ